MIAPVINLSGNSDVDPIKLTDWVAAEFLEFSDVAVIPVNMTLAALAQRGKDRVETPADALALADEFGADATVVTAITEYDPYDPPRIGLIMQWYGEDLWGTERVDPVAASRQASAVMPVSDDTGRPPIIQVQRSFNAADENVQKELKAYAEQRRGVRSAYGWRRYAKSQKEFFRYASWASIQPIHAMFTVSDEAR